MKKKRNDFVAKPIYELYRIIFDKYESLISKTKTQNLLFLQNYYKCQFIQNGSLTNLQFIG